MGRVLLCQYPALSPAKTTDVPRFGFIDVTKHALQALAEKTVEKLRNWQNSLPSELQVDLGNEGGEYVPHVLLLQ